jgi:hypothetical protein
MHLVVPRSRAVPLRNFHPTTERETSWVCPSKVQTGRLVRQARRHGTLSRVKKFRPVPHVTTRPPNGHATTSTAAVTNSPIHTNSETTQARTHEPSQTKSSHSQTGGRPGSQEGPPAQRHPRPFRILLLLPSAPPPARASRRQRRRRRG